MQLLRANRPKWWGRTPQPVPQQRSIIKQLSSKKKLVMRELRNPLRNFSNTVEQNIWEYSHKRGRKTASFRRHHPIIPWSHCSVQRGNSPAWHGFPHWERVSNLHPYPFGALHKGPSSVSPQPETRKAEK